MPGLKGLYGMTKSTLVASGLSDFLYASEYALVCGHILGDVSDIADTQGSSAAWAMG